MPRFFRSTLILLAAAALAACGNKGALVLPNKAADKAPAQQPDARAAKPAASPQNDTSNPAH